MAKKHIVVVLMSLALGCAEAGQGALETPDGDTSETADDVAQQEVSESTDVGSFDTDDSEQDIAPEQTIVVSGKSLDIVGQSPVEGLLVCVFERADLPCGKSNEEGVYTLPEVPANAEVALSYHKEGFFPELIMVRTGSDDLVLPITSAHATQQHADIILQLVDGTENPERGHLGLAVFRQNANNTYVDMIEGAQFELEPAGGLGPVYLTGEGLPLPDRSETSTNARAFVFNVEPGEVVVNLKHDYWKDCDVGGFGWPADGQASIRMRVVPGYVSAGVLLCIKPQ